jgi:hypothetical protein
VRDVTLLTGVEMSAGDTAVCRNIRYKVTCLTSRDHSIKIGSLFNQQIDTTALRYASGKYNVVLPDMCDCGFFSSDFVFIILCPVVSSNNIVN